MGGTPAAPAVPNLWVQPHWGRVEVVELSVMWSCGHGKVEARAEMNLTLDLQQEADLRTGLLHRNREKHSRKRDFCLHNCLMLASYFPVKLTDYSFLKQFSVSLFPLFLLV